MEWERYLDHLKFDSALVLEAARRGLEPDVPCCEGWTVRDLVGHLGEVQRHKELIVRERLQAPPDERIAIPDDGLTDWFAEGAAMLADTLAATDPATPVWTWHDPDQTAGFWYRRMAQEALIHRVDAEQSWGDVSPVDVELAADGVDEIISVMMTGLPTWASFAGAGNLVCVSIPGRSWSLEEGRFSGTSPNTGNTYTDLLTFELSDPSAGITTSISGDPVAMDLWLWGRGPVEALTVDGDPGLAATLREAAKDATQ